MHLNAYKSKIGQQGQFTYEMLSCVSAAIRLAQALGWLLGVGRVLLVAVSR
jgi:hypothetical protein